MNKYLMGVIQFIICFACYFAAVFIAIFGIVIWFHFQLRVVGFFTIIIGIVSTTFSVYLWGRRKHVK